MHVNMCPNITAVTNASLSPSNSGYALKAATDSGNGVFSFLGALAAGCVADKVMRNTAVQRGRAKGDESRGTEVQQEVSCLLGLKECRYASASRLTRGCSTQMSRKALIFAGLIGGTMPYLALALTCDNAYYIPLSSLRYRRDFPCRCTQLGDS